MSQNNGSAKRSEKGLLTPENCTVALIDHQPQMLFGTSNFDRQGIINSTVRGNVGDDEIGVEPPRDLRTLLRHFHQFYDSAVFDEPLGVRTTATFQAEGANRKTDIGFHDLVGRFGSMRDHQGEAQPLRLYAWPGESHSACRSGWP